MKRHLKTFNPIAILGAWTLAMIILTPILIFTSSTGSGGGEQKSLTMLVTMPMLTCVGAFVISIVIPFVFHEWFKNNRWFVLVIIIVLIPTIFSLWSFYPETSYSFKETLNESDGNKNKARTEYYDLENESIRSKAYYKNDKRDSIWTTYDNDGNIIDQKVYRNDTIVN